MLTATESKKGFTLLELIVVIIILGILASLGFIQFVKVIERSRSSEAKSILGQIRAAQDTYKLENGSYTTDTSLINIVFPTACTSTHFFSYSLGADAVTAVRCTSGGKSPDITSAYTITLNYSSGTWSGTTGYY